MCFDERNTLSRGRSAVPTIFLRTRWRLRSRVTDNRFCAFIPATLACAAGPSASRGAAGEGLAFLAADDFVLVADALALVWFRLAGGPHFGGELAHLLLVGAAHQDGRRIRNI